MKLIRQQNHTRHIISGSFTAMGLEPFPWGDVVAGLIDQKHVGNWLLIKEKLARMQGHVTGH